MTKLNTGPKWEEMFPVDIDQVPLKAQENAAVAFRRAGANPFEGKLEWRHWPPSHYAAKFGDLFYGDDGTNTLSDNPADILRPGEAVLVPGLKPADFWRGEHGQEYIKRNESPELLEGNRRFFEMALLSARRYMHPTRVLELGSNVGMNLRALRKLGAFQLADFTGVDVYDLAVERLNDHGFTGIQADVTDPDRPWGRDYDLVLIKGVLIHIEPEKRHHVYKAMYEASRDLIFIAEYFAAESRMQMYRDHADKMWLADYGGEFWDTYPDLECIDYGFAWKRDKLWQGAKAPDNLNWWLFSKRNQ